MPYPEYIKKQARQLFESRAAQARANDEQRYSEVLKRVPEAIKLRDQLARTSVKVAEVLLKGGDVESGIKAVEKENLALQQLLSVTLQQAGFAPDALMPHPACPKCSDTGVYEGRLCDCIIKLQKQLMYKRLGGPDSLDSSFDNFDLGYYPDTPVGGKGRVTCRAVMQKTFDSCKDYADSFGPGAHSLILRGGPGLGKTHLSMAIAKAVIEKGYDVLYVPFHRLISRLESAKFGKSEEDYQQALSPVLGCDLLIIDDLGSEMQGAFGVASLYEIVNTRLLEGQPVIVSTNLSPSEISARYGERIASRFFGGYDTLSFVGNDIRIQKKMGDRL